MISKRHLVIYVILLGLLTLAVPATSHAGVAVGISVRIGPPALPVYVQPVCPGPGYIWTPGYWAYGPDGYYWVPGAWVEPPVVGVLWTPGYWGWYEGFYVWHPGYWGPHVGFYGGINYGFGYTGVGFVGGFWEGREFHYNRAVTNVNVTVIHNTYITNVHETNVSRVSYNGGAGGIRAVPSARERNWEHERHFEPTGLQNRHMELARGNHDQLYSMNHGHPNIAASPKAGVYEGHGVVSSRGNFNRAGSNSDFKRANDERFNRGANNSADKFNRGNNGNLNRASNENFNRGNNGNFNRGGNNSNAGNLTRARDERLDRGANNSSDKFNRGNNGNFNRANNENFNRGNNGNLNRGNVNNNSGFKGGEPQGGNRNFDRAQRNNSYNNMPRGGNPNAGRPNGGRGEQHANNSGGEKHEEKHEHR